MSTSLHHSYRARQVAMRHAEPGDDAVLCRLARSCPQGERLRFYYERTTAGERNRSFDAVQALIAEGHTGVIAAATTALKCAWVQGRLELVAYLFDRMVHPDWRRQGIGRSLLRRQLDEAQHAALQYSLVLEDNHPNRALLESEGFQCHPRRLLYLTMIPRLTRRREHDDLLLSRPISESDGNWLDERLAAARGFADSARAGGDALLHLGVNPSRAAAVLYRHGPKVFVARPWQHSLVSWLPGVPALGRPIDSWSLSHIWAEDTYALHMLLESVAALAHRDQIALVLLPLYEGDPLIPQIRPFTVQRWGIAPPRACLYVHGNAASSVLSSEQRFLASARDG